MEDNKKYSLYFSYVMLVVAAGLVLWGGYLLFSHSASQIDAVQMIAMGVIVFGISPAMYKKRD